MSKRPVSRSSPCPACGHTDWCCWFDDGARLLCERDGTPPDGMTEIGRNGAQVTFARIDDSPRANGSAHTHRRAAKAASIDAARLHAEAVDRFTPAHAEALAASLGLTVDAVRALTPGWADAEALQAMQASGAGWRDDYPDGAFVFPERDGARRIVGLSLRARDGRKGCPKGLTRGLCVPEGFETNNSAVLVVEGASDVAACVALGINAIGRPSNTGGVEALAELLRDRRDVIVLGENDNKSDGRWPGRDGAVRVAQTLAQRWGRVVRWCLPPSDTKDVRAFYAAHGEQGAGRLLEHIEQHAQRVEPPNRPDALAYEPFPMDALPPVLRECAESHAASINVDGSGIAVPMLVACARAVSGSHIVDVGNGYRPPLTLWTCVVGAPSDGKTPALDVALAPVRAMRAQQADAYAEATRRHKRDLAQYAKARKAWDKNDSAHDPPPDEPDEPTRRKVSVSDTTIGALQDAMGANGGPLLLERDELAAMLASLGKYDKASGGGGDPEALCQAWNGGAWDCDRLTRHGALVRRACLSIAGGITRGNMAAWFPKLAPTGMLARFMLVMPPALEPRHWAERSEPSGAAEYDAAWNALWTLGGDAEDLRALTLTPEAMRLFGDAKYAYEHEHRANASDEPIAAMLGKLDAQLARIAGVLHLIRLVSGDDASQPDRIDGDTMQRAVRIIEWVRRENLRVYALLRETSEQRERRELAALVERKGGEMTPAQLQRASRKHSTAPAASDTLRALAAAGWGVFEEHPAPGPSGGRPRDALFRLYPRAETPAQSVPQGVS